MRRFLPCLCLTIALAACGGGGDASGPGTQPGGDGPLADWTVDAVLGDDDNTGSGEAPLKTIEEAFARAAFGDVIQLVPGTHPAPTTPMPDGVLLQGAQDMTTAASYVVHPEPAATAALQLGASCRASGLTVFASMSEGPAFGGDGIRIEGSGAVVQACVVQNTDSFHGTGIHVASTAADAEIRDTRVMGAFSFGIFFAETPSPTLVAGTQVSGASVGLYCFAPTAAALPDLGGGPTQSPGQNEIFDNALGVYIPFGGLSGGTFHAENCAWDLPLDIWNAVLAPPPGTLFDIRVDYVGVVPLLTIATDGATQAGN